MHQLIQRFIDPRHARFSALFMGIISGIFMIPMGLSLFAAAPTIGIVLPTWIWLLSVIGIPFVGILLHFSTRRLVHIKCFFVVLMVLLSLTYGTVAWYVLTWGMVDSLSMIVGFGMLVVLSVVGLQTYEITLKSPEREKMPHEIIGILDQTTGVIDLSTEAFSVQTRAKNIKRSTTLALRLAPLVGGISLLIVRSLPVTGDLILLLVVAFVFTTIGAIGAGSNLSYIVASRRWEQEHGKPILVKKNMTSS
ncbi:MAG: hypothetical protein WAW20_12725 [Anaerolineae bacterium]